MLKQLLDYTTREQLVRSELFNELTFPRAFCKDLDHVRETVVIDSPFLTETRTLYYAPLFIELISRGVSVRVNTRQTDSHDYWLKPKADKARRLLAKLGADIYVYKDLRHWKLAIVDDEVLWEGSLNILSHSHSKEIMRRSESTNLCQQMTDFKKDASIASLVLRR